MALIRKVDCVRLYVPDLEDGLAFYRVQLCHELIWRTETAAGLRLPESEAELVLQTEDQRQEVDLLVDSADEAVRLIEQAGGQVIVPPYQQSDYIGSLCVTRAKLKTTRQKRLNQMLGELKGGKLYMNMLWKKPYTSWLIFPPKIRFQ